MLTAPGRLEWWLHQSASAPVCVHILVAGGGRGRERMASYVGARASPSLLDDGAHSRESAQVQRTCYTRGLDDYDDDDGMLTSGSVRFAATTLTSAPPGP
jgi:hypothetical protein